MHILNKILAVFILTQLRFLNMQHGLCLLSPHVVSWANKVGPEACRSGGTGGTSPSTACSNKPILCHVLIPLPPGNLSLNVMFFQGLVPVS